MIVLGGFMTGILATVEGCAAFGITNPGGAIAGNGRQVRRTHCPFSTSYIVSTSKLVVSE